MGARNKQRSSSALLSSSLLHPNADSSVFSDGPPIGERLVGREILVCWDDGVWYDAVVVVYYEEPNEYKLVYRADDGIEIAKLRDRRWILAPKKASGPKHLVLDGAIIEFEYPRDGRRYQAMIYDYSHNGMRIKIAYIDEHTTDNLKGGGWDILSHSPCAETTALPAADPTSGPVGGVRKHSTRRSKEATATRSSRRR